MQFDLDGFSVHQQQSLLELLVLVMYVDGHFSMWEEAWLQELMTRMGFANENERQRAFDTVAARILPSVKHFQTARDHALALADAFTRPNQQRKVYTAIEWVMGSDGHVSTWENLLLSELRLKYRV